MDEYENTNQHIVLIIGLYIFEGLLRRGIIMLTDAQRNILKSEDWACKSTSGQRLNEFRSETGRFIETQVNLRKTRASGLHLNLLWNEKDINYCWLYFGLWIYHGSNKSCQKSEF